jgi:hypothetical protein
MGSSQRRTKLEDLRPPKSLEDLAREQGVPLEPVDLDKFVQLASEIWPTKKDVRDFDRWIRSIRGRPSY